jgi:hypothetical protein
MHAVWKKETNYDAEFSDEFCLIPCYFLSLRPKYYPQQHPVLKHR